MIREAIRRELDRRDWAVNRLVDECGKVGRATIYDYLNEDREIQTDNLESICETLDLILINRDISVPNSEQ